MSRRRRTAPQGGPLLRARALIERSLRSVRVRELLAAVFGVALCGGLRLLLPRFDVLGGTGTTDRDDLFLLLLVVFLTAYTAGYAVVTHLVLRRMPRRALLQAVSASLGPELTAFQRLVQGRSTTLGTAVQMLLNAALVVYLLLNHPPGVSRLTLMVLTVFAVAAAWVSCAVGFAMEYARADEDGEGFELTGCPDPLRRRWGEYLYMALMIQTSSAPADFSPLTPAARRAMSRQAVLAHIMTTVLLAVAVSALISAD